MKKFLIGLIVGMVLVGAWAWADFRYGTKEEHRREMVGRIKTRDVFSSPMEVIIEIKSDYWEAKKENRDYEMDIYEGRVYGLKCRGVVRDVMTGGQILVLDLEEIK